MYKTFAAGSFVLISLSFAALVGCSGTSTGTGLGDGGTGGGLFGGSSSGSSSSGSTGSGNTLDSVCASLASWGTKCGLSVNESDCKQEGASLNQSQLDQAAKCGSGACTDAATLNACLNAAASSTGGGGSTTTDAGSSQATCDSCIQANCESQLQACQNDQSCVELNACIQGGDSSQTCGNEYPDGISAYNAYMSCAAASCKAPCTE